MEQSLANKKHFKLARHHVIRGFFIAAIFVFSLLPLLFLLFNIKGSDLQFLFTKINPDDPTPVFYSALGNSVVYSLVSTIISVILALTVAFFLNSSNVKRKGLFVALLTLPMLVPTLSIGLGIRVLGGTNGFLDHLFGFSSDFLGMPGLIMGSVIVSFPPTFLVIYDALRYENKESYDAATVMGISKFSQFIHITLPYLVKPLITAFLASFTLIFADYGIPMETAGKLKTLPMLLYEQADNGQQYGRAAMIGMVLLVPAIISFVLDIIFREDKGGESKNQLIKSSTFFNIGTIVLISFVSFLLFVPQIAFISLAFMNGYPNNITFTFDHVSNIFSNIGGVGLTNYIINSLTISLLVGLLGTAIAFVFAYFTSRVDGILSKILGFAAMSSIAIPGIVLGIGYIFMFKWSNGFFYGTLLILISVNIVHFFGSPFIMAKNCLSKINRDYEVIGNTLGISRFKVFLKVLIPSSKGTLIEMFSYFFLNSMITISAVSFLSTYATSPLALLIAKYDKTGNFEMQATISLIIVVINILFKGIITLIHYLLVARVEKRKENEFMALSKNQFALLTFLEENGKGKYSQRQLSDILTVSLGTINKELNFCLESGYVQLTASGKLEITEKGLQVLEPYRVRKAIIIAAGFGSRMAPVTLNTPKPLVTVNGKRIIDTLLDALVAKGITNITIVRGYKKEQFDQLLEKYPTITFVDNHEFNVTNNISSLVKVVEKIDRCYICEADLVISNPKIIKKYEFSTCYMGAKVVETDDWCFKKVGGYIANYGMGGEDCYQAYGISYWNKEDSDKLRKDLVKVYNSKAGKENFWDAVPLRICKKNYHVEVKECLKTDITEIDNFSELVAIDSSYADYPDSDKY